MLTELSHPGGAILAQGQRQAKPPPLFQVKRMADHAQAFS
jgi:hypothetical protein